LVGAVGGVGADAFQVGYPQRAAGADWSRRVDQVAEVLHRMFERGAAE
jgi:hypothetical protein